MASCFLPRRVFKEAQTALMGNPWQKMTADQQIRYAVEKVYVEMAFYLFQHNYNDLVGEKKQKADTCRQALEAKLAGSAGQTNPLSRFYDEILKEAKAGGKKYGAPIQIGVPS